MRQTLVSVLHVGCNASNRFIFLKCLSTTVLYNHIKQHGHHGVFVLMEMAVGSHESVLYEGSELYRHVF